MKEIPLSQGYVAMVDDEDYEALSAFKWSANISHGKNHDSVYAVRAVHHKRKSTMIQMHRVITGAEPGELVDHRDTNGINNQRKNLRICNHSQNFQNARKRKSRFQHKGVHFRAAMRKPWEARVGGKTVGWFREECDAALAYNLVALEKYGEFARLNCYGTISN